MSINVGPRDYTVEEVLPFVTLDRTVREYDGFHVAMNSQRYVLFARDRKCVVCGIEGTVFRLEHSGPSQPDRAHFNLYAYDASGELVLMTKDHIHPRSKGGKDVQSNYQPMCYPCNHAKGATVG